MAIRYVKSEKFGSLEMCTFQVVQYVISIKLENLRKMCLELNFFIVFSTNTYEIKYLVLILKIYSECSFSCIPSTILS